MPSAAQPGSRKLLRVLGITFGLSVMIGDTIGAGILHTPGAIAAHLPEFWPFIAVWVVGGLYAALGANALAELGTMIPRSGGQYVFVRRGLGDYAGFIVGWSDWISTCGATAAMTIAFGEYAVGLMPELRTSRFVALLLIALLTLIQWSGVKWGGRMQTGTTILKAIVLLVLIVACFALGSRNPTSSVMQAEHEMPLLLAFVLSLQAVIFTYDGWSAPVYFSEEMEEPGRNVPRSMFGGLAVVVVIYLLINIGFARVVPLPTLAGQNLAAASVAQHLFGMSGNLILRGIMVVALLSAVNANLMLSPRILYAMSSDRMFWRGATEVNRGGTPDVSLLISSVVAAAFIVSGTFDQVIAKVAFFFVANYALSFFSLFVLRRREPDTDRPYRAWGHPVTTGIALIGSVAFLIGSIALDPRNSLWALILVVLSVPVFAVVKKTLAGAGGIDGEA